VQLTDKNQSEMRKSDAVAGKIFDLVDTENGVQILGGPDRPFPPPEITPCLYVILSLLY